jgi:exopolysaccharide biosynthesis polyprenyl glycosylphosphotransferase
VTPTPAGSGRRWQRRYAAAVTFSDLVIIMVGLAGAIIADIGDSAEGFRAHVVSGVIAGLLILVSLILNRAWDERTLGVGSEELKRLYHAFATAAIVLGLTGLAFQVESVRIWVFAVIPLTGFACFVSHYGLRKTLHRQRRQNRYMQSVLAVGNHEAVVELIRRTRRDCHFGWVVTGVCTPSGEGPDGAHAIEGVPVVGDLDSVGSAVRSSGYEVVAVGPTPGWGAGRLHRLAWQLEDTHTEIAVDPGLMEIAGPRLHITPVDGLPLLRLTQPRFDGMSRLVKNMIDRVGAAVLLVLLAPLLVLIAIAVRSDGGPALFFQERVGLGGKPFRMIKFRSMSVDAEAQLSALDLANEAGGPMFKMRHDPRVTKVGAIIRRYSMDELPQLFNVLTGSMSLVGPRPPLPREVATYSAAAQRRLLVRPGMTGLWQVSGRSNLTWDETVRLDLRYVENWSIALDAMIVWKTFGAVVRSTGAY